MISTMNTWLLLGPEAGTKDEFISTTIKNIKKDHGADTEFYKFYPFETEVPEIISLLKNGSLFSSFKIVRIDNVHEIKSQNAALLAEYCKKPVENTALILVSDQTQIDRRISDAVPKNGKKIFWEMYENQKRDWLQNYFRRQKIQITPDAVEELLELVENNTQEMKSACEKLSLFYGENSRIDLEQIEELIYHSKEENTFTLFDKVAVADFSSALEVVNKLVLSGENHPVQLLAGLQWQFKRLLQASELRDSNYILDDIWKKLNMRSKKGQKTYYTAMQKFSSPELRRIIITLVDYDTQFRSVGTQLHPQLLQMLIYSIIIKKGQKLPVYNDFPEFPERWTG